MIGFNMFGISCKTLQGCKPYKKFWSKILVPGPSINIHTDKTLYMLKLEKIHITLLIMKSFVL